MDFVKQEYWDNSYSSHSFTELPSNTPIIKWIKYVNQINPHGSCIEIGSYPGGFINEFGKLNYEINGIDLTPRITELNNIFISKGYKIGKFWQGDFTTYPFEKKYDIVCSFGFIEHFLDFESIIKRHIDILNKNGILLIVTPYFNNTIQHSLRKCIDNENLKRHNLKSMDIDKWENILNQNNFEIIKKGYIGGFDFWIDKQKRNYLQKLIRRIIYFSLPLLKKILYKESKHYSSYCGIIARKK